MKRLLLVLTAVLIESCLAFTAAHADTPFDFEAVRAKAKALAAKAYEKPKSKVPESLSKLTYDQYRDIRFNPNKAWWLNDRLPFLLHFFHPGFIHTDTIQVSEIDYKGQVKPIPFSKDLFTYERLPNLGNLSGDIGFTGLRVHYPLNNPGYFDELIVFQGASYFRALGQGMRWGLSARGLALNTGAGGPEEFPVFNEFWVQRPTTEAKDLVVYALMDSPSLTGAYRFTISPGPSTVVQVHNAVYPRAGANFKTFGVAALTSMFWFGENTPVHHPDLRPEVHDSDGLMMQRGNGEWIWRPLNNPNAVRVSSFSDDNPKGFGLVQRDRRYEDYDDIEAAYNLRPSVWVEPVGSWGKGVVRLVELPTPDETEDNIVAFWVPEQTPTSEKPFESDYKLHWYMEGKAGAMHPPAGYVESTREGTSKTHQPEVRRFWVNFDGAYLRTHPADEKIEAVVTVGKGAKLLNQSLEKNPYNGTWRVAIALLPDGSGQPVELRCFLKREPHILTETWSYLWNP